MSDRVYTTVPTDMRIEKTQRKLVKQSPVHSSYTSFSEQFQQVCALESMRERDYFKFLHFQEGLSAIEVQPFSILYNLAGRPHRYTPDMQVWAENTVYVDEVKTVKAAEKPAFKQKAGWFRGFLAGMGWAYRVVTDREIYVGERADNLRYLTPVLAHPAPHAEFERLATTFPGTEASMAELRQHLETVGISPTFIRRAVAHRLLRCDLTQPWLDLIFSW